MSINDNIENNLDKQFENFSWLPQKIELEDIDFGLKNFFESLDISLMDNTGRQRQVPVLWINQELWAQRKNYWEALTNEQGEEVKRPFIAIVRKGVKQGTAPNKRTIPRNKKFRVTKPRVFDGTLMGYETFLVKQPVWVDCEYEVRLVTSYAVDMNIFYKEILGDGFSDGQGYMDINGHQIRSVLGSPSEDNQVANIEDERIFQIVCPVTVHGKIFDPSDFERKNTINKVVLRITEEDGRGIGYQKTFGGVDPIRNSCNPANLYNYLGVFVTSVGSGKNYTIPAAFVNNSTGGTISQLAPGETYTIPMLSGSSTVVWSTGGTVTTLYDNDVYTLSAVTVLNHTGGTVASVEQGATVNLLSARVENYSGGTLSQLAPSGVYVIPDIDIYNTSGDLIDGGVDATQDYVIPDINVHNVDTGGNQIVAYSGNVYVSFPVAVNVENSDDSYTNTYSANGTYQLPDILIKNGNDVTINAAYPSVKNYTIPNFTVLNVLDGQSAVVAYSSTTRVSLPTSITVRNSGSTFTTAYTQNNSTQVLPNIQVLNSNAAVINPAYPSVRNYTIPAFTVLNTADGQSAVVAYSSTTRVSLPTSITVRNSGSTFTTAYTQNNSTQVLPNIQILNSNAAVINSAYPSVKNYTIPAFTVLNTADGQSAVVAYSSTTSVNFTPVGSGIRYAEDYIMTPSVSYANYDFGWQIANGGYTRTQPSFPATFAELDPTVTTTSYGYILKSNNIWGHKFRFTGAGGGYYDIDAPGWKTIAGAASSYATEVVNNVVFDHLTGKKWYDVNVTTTTWANALAASNTTSTVLAGETGWKMASMADYSTLMMVTTQNNRINNAFVFSNSLSVWTSMTDVNNTANAFSVKNTVNGNTVSLAKIQSRSYIRWKYFT